MKPVRQYLFPLASALLAAVIISAGALNRLDRWAQDALFQHPGVTSRDIIIIGIDETAFDVFGPYNTWDRNVMAAALEALAADPEKKPAVTAIDVLYAGATNPQADEHLAAAAAALGNVVTATMARFGDQITWTDSRATSLKTTIVEYEQPYDSLRECTIQGHINAMTDMDGVLRHALLYVKPEEQPVNSMASRAAQLYLKQKGQELILPSTNAAGHFYVPFTGLPGNYSDGVSIAWLIQGKVPADYWAGKIVLIGPYAPALQDTYFTSIDKGMPMYGVEFQANVIQSLLDHNFKSEVSDRFQAVLLLIICAAAALLFRRMNVAAGGLSALTVILLSVSFCCYLFGTGQVTHPLWIPVGILVLYLLSLAGHYIRAARERQALALEKERIQAELSLATRIQANSLPKDFPPFPERNEFDIYASMTPAKEVGGDLYDFFLIDDDHLALVIGDVSGKGIPAALFMMVTRARIHHVAMREASPGKILQIVNEEICSRNPEEMFVTVWLGVLEISTGKLTASSAGHEYPAVKNPEGSFELLKDRHGFVIGGVEGMRYREYEIQLLPGSRLFVYTDGVPEATSAADELFGTQRMLEALNTRENGTPEEILEAVDKAVWAFVGKAPQFDDLTMLCLQYNNVGQGDVPPVQNVAQ